VYKAFDREEGTEVAWNQFRVGSLSEKEKSRLEQEIDILKEVRCPHVIQYGNFQFVALAYSLQVDGFLDRPY